MATVDQPYADPAAGGQPLAPIPQLEQLPEFVTAGGLFELVFAAPKTVSVYYALLLRKRPDDAGRVVDAHTASVAAALAYLSREGAWAAVRGGEGRLPLYLDSRGLRHVEVTHISSDAPSDGGGPAPHLHTHVYVDPHVTAVDDGHTYPLDWASLDREMPMAAAVYDGGIEGDLQRELGVKFLPAGRTGTSRAEIQGVSDSLLATFAYSQCRGPVDAQRRLIATDLHARGRRLADVDRRGA